jgi:excisionase family DNA binding protein
MPNENEQQIVTRAGLSVESWVNLEEIAAHIGVSKDTIRVWIKKGTIPHSRAGKQYKFKISEIDEWLKSGEAAKFE